MAKTFSLTTAIDYTNGAPHIGHAYEKVLADVLARYHRLIGDEVFFLTGVDQHGQKVQQSAQREGVSPQDFVNTITAKFLDLWRQLNVQYDGWAATTQHDHKTVVRGILQRLFDAGEIYKDKQAGYYSIRQEQFLTEKERGPDGEFSEEWGTVEYREEENYYFRLARHKDWLANYLRSRDAVVLPDYRQTELSNAVEKLTGDLCISRPKTRLDWGIDLPFDPEFTTYVWFDALTNYISFLGYDPSLDYREQPAQFRHRWPALQIIGKDILVPAHGIYWMIMLHAAGFPDTAMPQLLVHGWWNISGTKMSKSLGNIVDPALLAQKYGTDGLRYYLMSDIATGKDADFSEERLIERYNSELANSLGNLLNRTLSMVGRYRAGRLVRGDYDEESLGLLRAFVSGAIPEIYKSRLDSHDPSGALGVVFGRLREEDLPDELRMPLSDLTLGEYRLLGLVQKCNFLVDFTAPWKLAKDEGQAARLDAVLYHLAETLRIIGLLISPVIPEAADRILDQLNWHGDTSGKLEPFRLSDASWGGLPDGHTLRPPRPLFPRIETE